MTGGKENREGDTSGIDNNVEIMLGNRQKQFGKNKKVRETNNKSLSENASKEAKKKRENIPEIHKVTRK